MGITGLLPVVKKATKNCHIKQLSGSTAAIDGFSWLYKGAFGCAQKLGTGEPTNAYVVYFMKYINILLANGIKPVVVLDGRNLPSKAVTDNKRREKKDTNKKLAKKFLQQGKKKEAWECFTRCVEVTPEMARELIKELRAKHIDYIIAPYEADAQMAFLAKNGLVDLIITEDSDLVVYQCPRIFFKLNADGYGSLYDRSKLHLCFGLKEKKFDFHKFRRMAICSGCDYLESIPGVGLGKAKKLFMSNTEDEDQQDVEKILKSASKTLGQDLDMPDDYIEGFIRAEKTFDYQIIFDPKTRTLMPLTSYEENVNPDELDFAGKIEDPKIALDMALGNIDVKTLQRVDNFYPSSKNGYGITSIWNPNYSKSSVHQSNNNKNSTALPSNVPQLAVEKTPVSKNSTHGKSFRVALPTWGKKRSLDDSPSPNEENTDIVSMYGTQVEPDEKESKNKKLCMSTTPVEIITQKISSPCKTAKIPFSKSPKVETRLSKLELEENLPRCVVKKNKVYAETIDEKKIIVKSKYFRPQHISSSPTNTNEVKTEMESHSPGSNDLIIEDLKSDIDSQLTIYSESQPCDESEVNLTALTKDCNGEDELMEDDDVQILYENEKSFRITRSSSNKNSSVGSPVYKGKVKKISPKKGASKLNCRRQGLSRQSKSNKLGVDSKQKSIKEMFAKVSKTA